MNARPEVRGEKSREAVDALRGYVYQIYQSAAAWVDLNSEGLLVLEVAEDYAVAAGGALDAVQVKDTAGNVTLNSTGIVAAINSFVKLTQSNPSHKVSLRYLTTSAIGMERATDDRVDGEAGLISWRKLAKSGDVAPLRSALAKSGISDNAKSYIAQLEEEQFRSDFLRGIHFDCGAPSLEAVRKSFRSRLHVLVRAEGGTVDQLAACEDAVIYRLLMSCAGKEDRTVTSVDLLEIVQRFTRVQVSQAVFDTRYVNALVSAAIPNGTALQTGAAILPIPDLPKLRLERTTLVEAGLACMSRNGLLWLHGATGLGKTLLARLIASRCRGRWGSANFRDMAAAQLASALEKVADVLPTAGIRGLIVDDLEHVSDQHVVDSFQYLLDSADRADLPIVVTSSNGISSKLKFSLGSKDDLSVKATDFDEEEVGTLVAISGGNSAHWCRYVYLASGGGHPQLAQALIQNLRQRGWPLEELRTLSAVLGENSAMADVKKESRARLLRELPTEALVLLQRLSLKIGRFKRSLVLDIAKHDPAIANAGLLLDELVGPWLDQTDIDHYQTSPLLSGLAAQTLSGAEQNAIHGAIADSLTRGPRLDASEMNSALISTIVSHNENALLRICIATITAPNEGLEAIGQHVDTLKYISLDDNNWPDKPFLRLMLRSAQLLTATLAENGSDRINSLLEAFYRAASEVTEPEIASIMQILIFTKILTSGKRVPNFPSIAGRLASLSVDTSNKFPPEMSGIAFASIDGIATYGFGFLMQIGLLEEIDDLVPVFDFVDKASPELRNGLLSPLKRPEFEADMYVRAAWLSEDKRKSIDGPRHAETFATLEAMASKWEAIDIAVACRKFQAILLDEYANRPEQAISVLESGLQKYGSTNSELVRAKAKVLHRSGDHAGSLDLARDLIDQDQITNPVERAFLGRDAAISAERQGDFRSARKYYLFARKAAQESTVESMIPMATGLLGDSALSAWQAGDRVTCLQDYAALLQELSELDPASSLRAAHVRAVSQHVLLWLDQQASGESRALPNGEPPQIYPGCVSNPEPHHSIGEWPVTAIELGWYMLALVESESGVDAGIQSKLEEYLPSGPILEGQALLLRGRLTNALSKLDWNALKAVLSDTINELAYHTANGGIEKTFRLPNVTYGRFPEASAETLINFVNLSQMHALLFAIVSAACGDIFALDNVLAISEGNPASLTIDALIQRAETSTRNAPLFAMLKQERAQIIEGGDGDPTSTVYLAYSAITIGTELRQMTAVGNKIATWYRSRWAKFLATQRFRLATPALNAPIIEKAITEGQSNSAVDLIDLVLATLPAVNIDGQANAKRFLLKTRSALLNVSTALREAQTD